jgi:hypothetical protein
VDVFWTEEEAAFRTSVRARFREGRIAAAAGPEVPPGLGLGGRIVFVEEAAWHDPGLGRRLAGCQEGPDPGGPVVAGVLDCAFVAGVAGHVFEAGARAARERGAFSSSLMGCREVQEKLAGLASGAALIRLGTCRLCRLLERGDRTRAGEEIAPLLSAAAALAVDVLAVATALLGAPWVAANLPPDGLLPGPERTKR